MLVTVGRLGGYEGHSEQSFSRYNLPPVRA